MIICAIVYLLIGLIWTFVSESEWGNGPYNKTLTVVFNTILWPICILLTMIKDTPYKNEDK